jgi:guanine nucleotide-binding protein G(I)/G(S)/G(T) subunit beta-1
MAKVWDYRDKNKCVANFKGHTSDINSVQWFPDGDAFASGSDDATCRLFDMKAHRQLNKYHAQEIFSTITAIDFSKSGYFLIAGYDENPFCVVWNTCTGEQETTLEHPTRASCLQSHPQGHAIATGCWDKILRIWA